MQISFFSHPAPGSPTCLLGDLERADAETSHSNGCTVIGTLGVRKTSFTRSPPYDSSDLCPQVPLWEA